MRKLYDGTIDLAHGMTEGLFRVLAFLCHCTLEFAGLLVFGILLITMWVFILAIPVTIVMAIVEAW